MTEKRAMFFFAVIIAGLFLSVSCGTRKGIPGVRTGYKDALTHGKLESKPVEEVITQTNCPVMGGVINKKIFVEHDGRTVYFCCAGCPETFKKNPEKYRKS